MQWENIQLDTEGPVALLRVDRPKQLNALNRATIAELHEALGALHEDDSIRAVILTGSGEKAFVAGADIKEFAGYSVDEGTQLAAQGHQKLFDYLASFHKPVIAAVNGFALGGGLELAMACHFRLASEKARLGLPETSLGVIPGYGGTQRLAQLVGRGHALQMITTAQMIKADKALEIGLVNEVLAPADLLNRAREIAAQVCENSPTAVSAAIKAVNAGYQEGLNGFKVEIEQFGKCFGQAEFKEGTTAFLEKRKPNFAASQDG
jgi:enoyl-CoA hydratase